MIDTAERITPVLRTPNDRLNERKRDEGGRFVTLGERGDHPPRVKLKPEVMRPAPIKPGQMPKKVY